MKKLLMLGTSHTSCKMIDVAKSRGIYTIVTDYLEPAESEAKMVADEYWMISTGDLDALEKKCREVHIDSVVCGTSLFNIKMTTELCKRLGIACWWTEESLNYSRNKRDFKDLCKKIGVPVAKDYFLSSEPTEEELSKIKFPVVVKPIDSCANRGMSYCYNKEEVVLACEYARTFSNSDKVIVEKMLRGIEFCGQYVMANGEASLLNLNAVFSQPGYPENCYSIITTCVSEEQLKKFKEEIDPYFVRALKEGGCHDGVADIQVILDEDGHYYALEMAFRLTADMFAIPMAGVTGFDSYEWLLDIALGDKHFAKDLPKMQDKVPEKCGCSYILWSKEESNISQVIGLDEIEKIPGIFFERKLPLPGDLVPIYSYLIVFTFVTDTRDQMYEMIKKINKTVSVIDDEGQNIAIYFDDFESIEKECNLQKI